MDNKAQDFMDMSMLKNLTVSIFENIDMSKNFVVTGEEQQKQTQHSQKYIPLHQEQQDEQAQLQPNKSSVSRLQIEIKKNHFDISPVPGEHFLLLFSASLQGKQVTEDGQFMMTNYRAVFFKGKKKRVDLPYGLIQEVQYLEKQHGAVFKLKYPHSWKFRNFTPKSKFYLFKNFGNVYIKPTQLKGKFCFEYYQKLKDLEPSYSFNLQQEYQKLEMYKNAELFRSWNNTNFSICQSYPPFFFVPYAFTKVIEASHHRKNRRLPILAYMYKSFQTKTQASMWITSAYEQNKQINKKVQTQLLKCISAQKVEVFVAEHKHSKMAEQVMFRSKVVMNYLKLQSNQELRNAQLKLIQVFLLTKKPFIFQVIKSNWYRFIFNLLQAVHQIRNAILSQKSVIIRCTTGYDKSIVLASLTQIVLDPFFRTIKGFQSLVMRMFVYSGHPFASRLGDKNSGKQISPIFIQFLDCVSQLMFQNFTAFEFNFKFLSQLANQMQNNLYGTFATNSPKQYVQNNIETETLSIWRYLSSPTTKNANYTKVNGLLQFSYNFQSFRVWKQYFSSLVTKKKDSYGFQTAAEDNQDYPNIAALRLSKQNQELMAEIKMKLKVIVELKHQIGPIS